MQKITTNLLKWYDDNHRQLPWRITPLEQKSGVKADPYRVWLSEIMLQQTTVAAVKPYFEKFIKLWPDIFALSRASQDEILAAWAGLGYYSRGRNLKKCADQIVKDYNGIFPHSLQKLRCLSGIGDYTSAAIAAIAFNQDVAVVDGNVERVISRLFALETPLPQAKTEIKQKTQALTPKRRPGDFAQALMDLGANICRPKNPSCLICPLNVSCVANHHGTSEAYPIKVKKKPRPQRKGVAFVAISNKHNIYLEKRHDKGLLGGMTQIPNQFSENDVSDVASAPFKAHWQFVGQAKHIFTHFSLLLDVYLATHVQENSAGNGWWWPIDQLDKVALPSVMKKAIATAKITVL